MYLNYFKKLRFGNDKQYFDERYKRLFDNITEDTVKIKGLNIRNHVLHQMSINNETIYSLVRKDKVVLDSS